MQAYPSYSEANSMFRLNLRHHCKCLRVGRGHHAAVIDYCDLAAVSRLTRDLGISELYFQFAV